MFDRESLYDKIDDLDSEVRRLRLLLLRARRQIGRETFLKAPEDWLSVLRDIDAELEEENAATPVAQGQWPSGCPCNSAPGPCENCSPAADCEWCMGTGYLPTDAPCDRCTVKVPRELLERIAKPVLQCLQEDAHLDACAELRALLDKEND